MPVKPKRKHGEDSSIINNTAFSNVKQSPNKMQQVKLLWGDESVPERDYETTLTGNNHQNNSWGSEWKSVSDMMSSPTKSVQQKENLGDGTGRIVR